MVQKQSSCTGIFSFNLNKDPRVPILTVFDVEKCTNMRNMLRYLLQSSCRVRYQVADGGNGSLMTALGTLLFTWRPTPSKTQRNQQKRNTSQLPRAADVPQLASGVMKLFIVLPFESSLKRQSSVEQTLSKLSHL